MAKRAGRAERFKALMARLEDDLELLDLLLALAEGMAKHRRVRSVGVGRSLRKIQSD